MNCDRVFAVLTRGPFPTGDPSDEAVEAHLARCPDCRRLAEALRPAARVKDEIGLRSTEIVGRMVEEIVGSEERRRLPGYWGEASGEAADEILARFSDASEAGVETTPPASLGAEKHATPQDARHDDSTRRMGRFFSLRHSRAWLFGLAGVIGVSLGVALRFWGFATEPPLWGGAGHRVLSVHAQQDPNADNPRLLATSHQLLATERLPAACTAPPKAPEQPKASDGRVKHTLASFASPVEHQACCTQCHHAGAGKEIPVAAASVVRNNCKFCHGDMPRTAVDTW